MHIFKMTLSNNQSHFQCLKDGLHEYASSEFWKSGPTARNLPYKPDHCAKSGTTDKGTIPQLSHRCDLEDLHILCSQTVKIFNISNATENVTECIRIWKLFELTFTSYEGKCASLLR